MSSVKTQKTNKKSSSDYPEVGKTIQRLRKAYNLSLGELSEQSGVAKSIISQIERNETNPTIGTLGRLSTALDTSIDEVLRTENDPFFIEHAPKSNIPILTSEDGLCSLKIIGWAQVLNVVQWYDFSAKPGGVLESSPHPKCSIENLSVREGELEVTVGSEVKQVKQGESLRYRGDVEHKIVNIGTIDARATMVNILR